MRVVAGSLLGNQIRLVWDCERCAALRDVTWVDDETSQYAQYTGRVIGCDTLEEAVRQAKKIVIDAARLVILINPVEDPESEPVTEFEIVELPSVTHGWAPTSLA